MDRTPDMTNHQAAIQVQNVKDLIYELGITMKEFAERTGVAYGTCTNNFGKSKRVTVPSKKTLEKIEETLQLEPGFLSVPPDQRNGAHAPQKKSKNDDGMSTISIVSDDGELKASFEVTTIKARKMIFDALA